MKLLHVIATPRGSKSNTLPISSAFLDALRAQRTDLEVEVLDLPTAALPEMMEPEVGTKALLVAGGTVDVAHVPTWPRIVALIDQFLSADAYLVTAPMWNFGIPYHLKHWIDCIIQPGYLFRYNELGYPEPLVHDKRMVCITSRGGDYSPEGPMGQFDVQEPYLRAIFGFVGITNLEFVNAQPMDITPEMRAVAVEAAMGAARDLGSRHDWTTPTPVAG